MICFDVKSFTNANKTSLFLLAFVKDLTSKQITTDIAFASAQSAVNETCMTLRYVTLYRAEPKEVKNKKLTRKDRKLKPTILVSFYEVISPGESSSLRWEQKVFVK